MDIHKGESGPPLGTDDCAATAARHRFRALCGTRSRIPADLRGATDQSTLAVRASNQPGLSTCELEGGQGPTVQVCARLGSQFFTCRTALFRPHACRPALEKDSPTAMARRGARGVWGTDSCCPP